MNAKLEADWAYLLDDAGEASSRSPILQSRYDDRTERVELFVARTLGMDPGQKYELQSLGSETKFK